MSANIVLFKCTLSRSTGYYTTSCDTTSLDITAASCTLACASGYTSSRAPGVTCGTNAGTFTVSDACAANTGTLLSSTGYDMTSCDTTSVAITAASCTLSRASSYTSSGTPGVTCGTNAGAQQGVMLRGTLSSAMAPSEVTTERP